MTSLGNVYYPDSFSYYQNCSNSGTISPETEIAKTTNWLVGRVEDKKHVIIKE